MNDNKAGEVILESTTISAATTTYSKQMNEPYQVAYFIVTVSSIAGSQTLDILIQAFNQATSSPGSWTTIGRLQKVLDATGTYVFLVGESADHGGEIDGVIPIPLPYYWRLGCVTSTADSISLSIAVLPVGR